MPNVLSPRDLVFRPDNMDETVPHTSYMYKNQVSIHVIENGLHFCKFVRFPILSKPWPPFESLMGELAHFEKILESTL